MRRDEVFVNGNGLYCVLARLAVAVRQPDIADILRRSDPLGRCAVTPIDLDDDGIFCPRVNDGQIRLKSTNFAAHVADWGNPSFRGASGRTCVIRVDIRDDDGKVGPQLLVASPPKPDAVVLRVKFRRESRVHDVASRVDHVGRKALRQGHIQTDRRPFTKRQVVRGPGVAKDERPTQEAEAYWSEPDWRSRRRSAFATHRSNRRDLMAETSGLGITRRHRKLNGGRAEILGVLD